MAKQEGEREARGQKRKVSAALTSQGVRPALEDDVGGAQRPPRPVEVHGRLLERPELREEFVEVRIQDLVVEIRDVELGRGSSSSGVAPLESPAALGAVELNKEGELMAGSVGDLTLFQY
jgi:hypothetical protein